MTDMEKIDLLEQKMMMFIHHDPMRIQHLMKVHRFAQMIGRMDMDHQILVEADFLVNFYEDNLAKDAIDTALQKIFRTEAGKTLCRLCYIND